jgi:hypothetical protein
VKAVVNTSVTGLINNDESDIINATEDMPVPRPPQQKLTYNILKLAINATVADEDIALFYLSVSVPNLTKHLSQTYAASLVITRRWTWILLLIYNRIPACSFVLLLWTKTYMHSEEACEVDPHHDLPLNFRLRLSRSL